ncbi:MAG: type II/IV secretion system ATPase subunit [Methanocorpusculum sp.]|uniref:type II/IV secretion system ATPase subunit n=1 Tax=Methanocorpusculum sp. TaxID=2058474 RepID=UPI002716337D|nr:type II/IV secretion system ATPase subunit [Methanocorpusculum sp.]MDO9523029.1 type II/IV secretion system ATPase subunit [Methanocorpusculum sp.]
MKPQEARKEKQKHLRTRIRSRFFKKPVETEEKEKKSDVKFPRFFRKKSSAIIFETPPVVLEIPPCETNDIILDQYWLTPPHAYVTILKDRKNHIRYLITEPKLCEKEYAILEESFEYLRSTLIYDSPRKRDEARMDRDLLIKTITSFDKEISSERVEILIYYLYRNFLGYGKLDPLLHDEKIEDITCNGADIPVFLYHSRFGNIETNCIFEKIELNKFVLKLAQKAGKQLSLTTPLVDAALPDGSRAQITYSDIISSKGSSFTIRKFKADPMTPADLVAGGTYSSELMAYIWLAVENRKSMIIAGGTASGKTSTMNAASFFIPDVAKIVSIEDTREIQLPHINWLPMRTRESTASVSAGNIDMFSLLRAALRQRPEYIIVGEVRGPEAQTLFQAMNTGHTTFSTLHAGNVNETVNRLTNDPINVPIAMFGALDLIVIQGLLYGEGKGFRRCLSLHEISTNDEKIICKPLFIWDHKTDSFVKIFEESKVFDSIAYQNGWSKDELEKRLMNRKNTLDQLRLNEITTPLEVETAIQDLVLSERR